LRHNNSRWRMEANRLIRFWFALCLRPPRRTIGVWHLAKGSWVCRDRGSPVLEKEAFWRRLNQESIVVSDRRKKIVNLLLDGFEGKLTTEK